MSKELDISQEQIENRIFTFRDVQVMLDRDLAEMYQVEVKRLNEQVKRNIERFPESFRFQLTDSEKNELVAICDRFESLKHSVYNPYAFTEQGIAMLSAVLRSETAVQVSIRIMRAFVEMRKFIVHHRGLLQRVENIERKQIEADHKFERVFKALEANTIPSQGVFFDGQVYDAYELASRIIRSAKQSIVLIDNYIDDTVLTHLSKKKKGVKVILLTKNPSKQLSLDVQKANEQYGNFQLKLFSKSHDRFLIIDGNDVYHLGASLKDLGKKWFAFSKLENETVKHLMDTISEML
jgi:3-dehydroquinate dehydratase